MAEGAQEQPRRLSFRGSLTGLAKEAANHAKGAAQHAKEAAAHHAKDAAHSLVSLAPPLGRLSGMKLSSSQRAAGPPEPPLDVAWQVGGKYRVAHEGVHLWGTPNCHGDSRGVLAARDSVLLVALQEPDGGVGPASGLVVPSTSEVSGWIDLDGPSQWEEDEGGGPPLVRRCLEGSWACKARYRVRSSALLRTGKLMTSDIAGEAVPGEEVLVLELGYTELELGEEQGEKQKARLRMLVSTDKGLVGWLSPETADGEQLLYGVNLLSSKVVEVHREDTANDEPPWMGPRSSYLAPGPVPWIVGGQYRALERIPLLDQPGDWGQPISTIAAGSLMAIQTLQMEECPCAYVTIEEGDAAGTTGWVRCCGKDGRDAVDIRDHLEFARVLAKIEADRIERAKEKEKVPNKEAPRSRCTPTCCACLCYPKGPRRGAREAAR